jgi:hypothetical protein
MNGIAGQACVKRNSCYFELGLEVGVSSLPSFLQFDIFATGEV